MLRSAWYYPWKRFIFAHVLRMCKVAPARLRAIGCWCTVISNNIVRRACIKKIWYQMAQRCISCINKMLQRAGMLNDDHFVNVSRSNRLILNCRYWFVSSKFSTNEILKWKSLSFIWCLLWHVCNSNTWEISNTCNTFQNERYGGNEIV